MANSLSLGGALCCFLLFISLQTVHVSSTVQTVPQCGSLPAGMKVLDFSVRPEGGSLAELSDAELVDEDTWEPWGISITVVPSDTDYHRAQILNSSLVVDENYSDIDLGTPNVDFGGPGKGDGGKSGRLGENSVFRGNLLIISERNDGYADDSAFGGDITFTFQEPMPLAYIDFVDIDLDEVDGYIAAYNGDGDQIAFLPIYALGDNAYYKAVFDILGVQTLRVHLGGSGGKLFNFQSFFFFSN